MIKSGLTSIKQEVTYILVLENLLPTKDYREIGLGYPRIKIKFEIIVAR